MQSIEQTKAIINQSTPTEENPIIIKPFEDYKSYNKYYKASVIYNTNFINPQLTIMRSYQTDIAIYNRRNGFLILNLDYYNSSKTTKEQLEHFLFKYVPAFKQGVIYLPDNKFNELMETFYSSDVGLYENKEYNIIRTWKAQKNIINTLNCKYLTPEEKINELLPLTPESYKEILKTRFKIIEEVEKQDIKFKIVKTWKGSPENCKYRTSDLIKTEIKIISETSYYHDRRSFKDKTLFNGYDMGVTNTKELSRSWNRWKTKL